MSRLATRATPLQEALWWVDQRAKNKSVYNMTWPLGCSHAPDLDALQVAWQAVVDRHDAMRAALVPGEAGELEMVVLPELAVRIGRIEVDGPPSAELFRLIAEEVHQQPIQLDQAPLAKLVAVRIGDQHELLLTVHHVVSDGWGNQIMVNDLSRAYAAACRGDQPTFDSEAPSFLEHVARPRDWRKGLEYWTKTLDGVVATTVAADRQATGEAGAMLQYALSDDAAAGITQLTRTTMATSFITVLAALQVVLARGGAGPDVGVGIVVANRPTKQDQNLVGYVANLCVATTTVTEQDTIGDVVTRARNSVWSVLAHQSVPYPVVFGALPEATQQTLGGTTPLLLDYIGTIGFDLSLGDLELTLQRTPNRTARSDIAVAIWETGDSFAIELEYNTGRYDAATVLGLIQDVDTVLSTAAETPIADLELSTRSAPGHLDHQPVPVVPGRLPDTPVTGLVAEVWEQVLGRPPAAPDEDFFAQGGRSLKVLQLASTILTDTGVTLDLTRWLAEPTPARLIEQVASTVPGGTSTLVTLRDGDGGPHLHLLPGAGGGPHDYRALLEALPAHWRITASQERVPYRSVPEMAEAYRSDLDSWPDLLGGWSMGGLTAFEIARTTPVPLVLLDPAPPVGYARAGWFEAFVAMTNASLGVEVATPEAGELNIAVLAAYLRHAGQGVPAAVLAEQWETYRRHLEAVVGYRPTSGVDAPALLVVAELLDSQVDQWREWLGPTESIRLDTDHFGVLSTRSVRTIGPSLVSFAEPARLPHRPVSRG